MTAAARQALRVDALAKLDAQLSKKGPVRSMGPGRPRARTLVDLAIGLVGHEPNGELAAAFVDALARIVDAMRVAFPDNLFWDLDYLAATLVRDARAAAVPERALAAAAEPIVTLQAQFGSTTAIRFRYVHDFLYGFDWAKWVAKQPVSRRAVGPFDPAFVESLQRRGEELVEAIVAGDDAKYPPLTTAHHRNPFGFMRDPAAELTLHRRLARLHLVPVESWRTDARPTWHLDHAALRRAEAVKLGIVRDD